ncbi:C1 family peptidase [Undibacterium squillarum]|uniref:Peptidase C1A papain C-terminal domain-containing protein n=1 Tax=Undibacterium squillarum TaxID=1131567 RepID=A0ABQ2Y1Q0_9BURK|nr:C1 family peptidase [Undibacterium squillarum]GGX48281.1 hypothetical protein GCM10010946_28560 [Undibacterium squillarum]
MPRPSTVTTPQRTLDARADRQDIRDQWFQPEVRHLSARFPDDATVESVWNAYADAGFIRNQGNDGACTGFGLAAVIHYLNWLRSDPVMPRSARMLYHLAQLYDEWPGEDYSGSSCRGALKGWHKHGVCSEDLWPFTVAEDGSAPAFEAPQSGWDSDALQCMLGVYYRVDKSDITAMQAAIAQTGALYASSATHAGWDTPRWPDRKRPAQLSSIQQLPVIQPHAIRQGGHAFALIGYNETGFVVQNSWGESWGWRGLAILTYDDWLTLGTDAWVIAMGVPAAASASASTAPAAFRRGKLPRQPAQAGVLSSDQAYAHTVVLDSSGRAIQRLVQFANAADSLEYLLYTAPLAWLQQQKRGSKLRLALCALSGLLDEAAQIQAIARYAPAFLAQGIYPVFLIWNSGISRLSDLLQQQYGSSTPSPALSRSIEANADQLALKALWTQLRHNAAQSVKPDHPPRALHSVISSLQALQKTQGAQGMELHLLADCTGVQLAGPLLAHKSLHFQSVQLMTPACSLDFASDTLGKAIQEKRLSPAQWHLYALTQEADQHSRFAGVYQGSLLRLIAHALEDRCQTPLLGLAASLDSDSLHNGQWNRACLPELQHWQDLFWGRQAPPAGFSRHERGLSKAASQRLTLLDTPLTQDALPPLSQLAHLLPDMLKRMLRKA